MDKRQSFNHPRVREDFPIGHPVFINEQLAFIVGYTQAQIRDQVALWVQVKFPNEDYFNCDPYVLNLNKSSDSRLEGEDVEESTDQAEEAETDKATT